MDGGDLRVFIVGNGPSLARTDLNKLIGEESWGMAEIQHIYDKTDWRPTRYWWNDHPQDIDHLYSILFHVAQDYPCWIRSDVKEILTGDYDLSRYGRGAWGALAYEKGLLPYKGSLDHVHGWDTCVSHCAGFIRNMDGTPDLRRPPGWHGLDSGILCKYGSGLNCMLQQAVIEEYNPIYLVGCDLGFKGVHVAGNDDPDHFSPDYNRRVREPERAVIDEDTHNDFHKHAKEYCGSHGIELINATVGGYLEVHPRVDYGSLFHNR